MIDEQLLSELATPTRPMAIRPLSEVLHRARMLRRRRRSVTTAATGLAVAVAVGAFTLPDRWGAFGRMDWAAEATLRPAGESDRDCGGGYGTKVMPSDVPDVLYLPSSSVSGRMFGRPGVHHDQPNCVADRVGAVWYGLTGSSVTRRLSILGPSISAPVAGSRVVVNGSNATLHDLRDQDMGLQVYWTRPDGGRWLAWVEGLSRDDALAAVRAIRFDAGDIDRGRPLPLLPLSLPLPGGPVAGHGSNSLWANYGAAESDAGNWQFQVQQEGNLPLTARMGTRLIDVNGRRGWWNGQDQSLTWQVPEGVVVSISGLDRKRALEVARSVVRISPEDPRLRRTL